MTEKELLTQLRTEFPSAIANNYPFPEPHEGKSEIKAIILGADPSHIVNDKPVPMEKVFGLHQENSPYWRSIKRNLDMIPGLGMDNVYVQNVCRNCFNKETAKNKDWLTIARKYWIPFLKEELNKKFHGSVPILMTTEVILNASLKNESKKLKASDIYNKNITIAPEDNLFGRELLAFYRHFAYSLEKKSNYRSFLSQKINAAIN